MAEVLTRTRGVETREKLVVTVLAMLRDRSPEDLRVEEVLEVSGISTGSLYHHFDDFGHLVETALIRRYVDILETAAELVEEVLNQLLTGDDFRLAAGRAVRRFAEFNAPEIRFERARILGMCDSHPRMREALGEAQQQATDRITTLFEAEQQGSGRVNPNLDARTLAVFIQSYALGRIVDDIVPNPMDQEQWLNLIETLTTKVILADQ
jgi:AcrR family transcriptional regulator